MLDKLFYFIINFAKKNKQTNRKNVGRDTATAVVNYSGHGYVKKKQKQKTKKTQRYKKNYSYIQQVAGRNKGRALLHFKQIDFNERGSSQS